MSPAEMGATARECEIAATNKRDPGVTMIYAALGSKRKSGTRVFDTRVSTPTIPTQNLGKAYDIACHSLHPKGRPPVLQESLAKKNIEAAQRGEHDPDRLAAIALTSLAQFHRNVAQHFGSHQFLHVGTGYAGDCREALGLRYVGLSRQSDPLTF